MGGEDLTPVTRPVFHRENTKKPLDILHIKVFASFEGDNLCWQRKKLIKTLGLGMIKMKNYSRVNLGINFNLS